MMLARLIFPGKRNAGRSRSQRRPRVVPMWRTRPALALWAALLAGGIAGGGWLAARAGLPQRVVAAGGNALVEASAGLGFVVRDVFVVGRTATPKATLLEAVGVGRGTPILALDLEAARERVQALPWVREASVRRVLPDTVVVEIVERRPLAIWQHDRKFAVIDDRGEVILRDDVGPFSDLMVVVGEDAPANAQALVQMLASEPDLLPRVRAAVRVGGRRWNLHFAEGVDVKLPEDAPEAAWHRLADYERLHHVLDKPVRVLDLRIADRLVVLPAENAGERGNDA